MRFEIDEKELDSYRRAADFLNINDVEVVSVQLEIGIYGGAAGSHLLAFLGDTHMPVVTTLHTLLQDPNLDQMAVMKQLVFPTKVNPRAFGHAQIFIFCTYGRRLSNV